MIHVLGNPTEEELAAITLALSYQAQRNGVERLSSRAQARSAGVGRLPHILCSGGTSASMRVAGPAQPSAWALANHYPGATFDELLYLVRCSARYS